MTERTRRPKSATKLIAHVGDLARGATKKFTLTCRGERLEAMLVNFGGRHVAYLNRCRHVGISLDWVDNQFFTEDGRYLICANHGALYEPGTGECLWGPCAGAFLHRIPLTIEDGKIFARCPESEMSAD
ncbi:MAG TPA: Rieske 2Fe-2S domain-containing protein [Candidatus Binatia bacterium]|jgi:nitrite reductase/ring-hydroxylating ferredoxin subunit